MAVNVGYPPAGLPPRAPSLSHPPHEASRLRRIRRYAVPPWMVEQATERRLAGDWQGACAAANIDVAFDLADVAGKYGRSVAAALHDDLRHFAPDLLRWHLPRLDRGRTTIVPGQQMILSGAGDGHPGVSPTLHIRTPPSKVHGSQRLRLHFAPNDLYTAGLSLNVPYCAFWYLVIQDWRTSRHLWDVRHHQELRERCGGDETRAPFFHSDGTPRTAEELPTAHPGHADRAALTEWVTLLHERGEVETAFAAAGVELDAVPFKIRDGYKVDRVHPLDVLARMPLDPVRLATEVRLLAAALGIDRFWIPYRQYAAILVDDRGPDEGPLVQVREFEIEDEYTERPDPGVVLPEACWRRPPDLDLLRDGHPPESLHPLVRGALFPGRTATVGATGTYGVRTDRALFPGRTATVGPPPGPSLPVPVRIRCQGRWHEVCSRDGVLHIPHSAEEQRRENALQAFGGATAGCFAVRNAWTSGTGWLPRALRAQRDDLFARVQHGDLPGVLRLLDAGVDPHVRDGRQRTLLHMLPLLDRGGEPSVRGRKGREMAHLLRNLDQDGLLARLLEAGLDIEAKDGYQRTPLFAAICGDGSVSLVQALLAAGAQIDVWGKVNGWTTSLHQVIIQERRRRFDLDFLKDRIEREYPEFAPEPPEDRLTALRRRRRERLAARAAAG